jgi:glyoxylase-like metal-dependent hydrolase (beta-lactamase superfamily II)
MNIVIGGGVGEHGRNCFYVEGQQASIMVDCGIMSEGDAHPYPRLTAEQISRVNWLLLTHSHQDHTAAYPWLVSQGFRGQVLASEETFAQLPFEVEKPCVIEAGQGLDLEQDLHVSCGRSGHCVGSLWYEIDFQGRRLLFSGDYTEDTLLYACDKLRGHWADIAFLDSSRNPVFGSAEALQMQILRAVTNTIREGRPVILPVPRHGRGLELMQLLYGIGHFRLDEDSQAARDAIPFQQEWFKQPLKDASSQGGSIYFIADTQLKKPGNRVLAERLVAEGGLLLLTGHAEDNSFSMRFVKRGEASIISYPTHASDRAVDLLCSLNSFAQVVRTHSERHPDPGPIILAD